MSTLKFIHHDENDLLRKRSRSPSPSPLPSASTVLPAVICASCNQEGHERRTSKRCRFYVSRAQKQNFLTVSATQNEIAEEVYEQVINEVQERAVEDVQSNVHQAENTESQPIFCLECLQDGHLQKDCPVLFYKRNQKMTSHLSGRDPELLKEIVRHDIGRMKIECSFCKAKMWIDEKSNNSVSNPVFQLCCGKGQYVLRPFQPTPPLIADLLKENNQAAKEFKQNIRAYNSALAFTSLGAEIDTSVQNRVNGAYAFRIHGSVYHRIGNSLQPTSGRAPNFAQIYVYDAANELQNRHLVAKQVAIETLEKLQSLMHEVNPFVRDFKTMAQLDQETPGGLPDISMIFRAGDTPDPRRYNAPTTSTEIGVLILGTEADRDISKPSHRGVVIRLKNDSSGESQLKTINECNENYDPMHYVLLFPTGQTGWRIDLKNINGTKNVTIMQFYRFHLMYRAPTSTDKICHLHLFGNLFHQYVVDMYAKMEQERLNFIRRNQKTLRSELYNNLQDAVNVDDCDLSAVGQKVILPSSFIGSPRHMTQLYQDAMSIVRKHGKPDLFVTFTCNPGWPEIQRELLFGQAASDRPDLCSRVFNMKLKSLMKDITKHKVLGEVVAHIHTIEFQKRGLPHAHILLILAPEDKIQEEDIDKLISAEIPDQATDPLLYETITKMMMHGPCGLLKPNAQCMKDGSCSKKYPKTFNTTTSVPQAGLGGYPEYRRRRDGRTIKKGEHVLDNRWVVPHNKYLCMKYNAHINVEICASFTSVKYVYKYVYKGHDRAQVAMDKVDEVQKFIDARYVSAAEACWRLFSFSLHDEYPKHQRLSIHLPDEQAVYFDESSTAEEIRSRREKKTTLMGWFEANERFENARELLYIEFPEKFVWAKLSSGRGTSEWGWKLRQNKLDTTIGRVYAISPRDSEKFCLRILLHHVRGAKSFDDLKTVRGVLHVSFRDAACALNLLEDDKEWIRCLEDAVNFQRPSTLRNLFAIILVFNMPSNPVELWTRFRNDFVEDYLHKRCHLLKDFTLDFDQHDYDCGLWDIEERLQQHGFSLLNYTGFSLPATDPRDSYNSLLSEEQLREPRVIREQLLLNMLTALEKSKEYTFNTDQKAVYDHVMNLVESTQIGMPKVVFVDGPGGTGKTYLFNALLDATRRDYGIALAVAASGTAALLLNGGKTAHSAFKIPLCCNEYSLCAMSPSSALGRLIRQTKLILWDEASMVSTNVLEAVDRSFKEVCKIDNPAFAEIPFGGRVMVFGGDFRQVLPVVPKASRSVVISQCINRSHLWQHFKSMRLHTNMRVSAAASSNQPEIAKASANFADYLLKIGNGQVPTLNDQNAIQLDAQMIIPGDNMHHLAEAVFHQFQGSLYDADPKVFLINRAILTPLNSHVSKINETLLDEMDKNGAQIIDCFSADALCQTDGVDTLRYPVEFLNKIETGSLPPHHLRLKVGCPIMLLRNLDPSQGLCNGTRLICLSVTSKVIQAEIATGSHTGNIVAIPRIKLESQEEQVGVHFSRIQFPIRLAFAMTINKSQGQTLDFVGLYLPSPVFSHGQLYVAMSRVRSPKSLKILIGHKYRTHITNSTSNVVFREVFK